MSDPRIAAALAKIAAAERRLVATGETTTRVGGGRAPSRSDRYKKASADIHAAKQIRNRLFVDIVGPAEVAPLELVKEFKLTGREAVHILETARTGTPLLREHVFGPDRPARKSSRWRENQ